MRPPKASISRNQVTLADAPDGRVARHLSNHFPVYGHQGGVGPVRAAAYARLATGVAAPDDNDVDGAI